MRRRYVTTDVFTQTLFGGNPLAVVLDAQGLSDAQMQSVAAEFNYSETTFVLPPREQAHTARVRIFTPKAELPFAGHPNVGTAFVLAHHGVTPSRHGYVFEEAAGLVPMRLLHDNGEVAGAELTAPAGLIRRIGPTVAQVAACLGLAPADILLARHAPEIASVGIGFVIAEIASRAALRAAASNIAAFAALFPMARAQEIFFYTRDIGPEDGACDITARMFAPMDGITEDPATGSAAAAAAALLADLLSEDGAMTLRVSQGIDMGRPSLLVAHASRTHGTVGNVRVGGSCVRVMDGSFTLAGGLS